MIEKNRRLIFNDKNLVLRVFVNKKLIPLYILIFIAAIYLGVSYIDPIRHIVFPEKVSNEEYNKAIQNSNIEQVSNPKKVVASPIAPLFERPETIVYSELHKMANTKILADEIWGETNINEEGVNALILEITNSNYSDKDILLDMLNNWKKSDFSHAVEEHNYLWNKLDGTVGEAYGLR